MFAFVLRTYKKGDPKKREGLTIASSIRFLLEIVWKRPIGDTQTGLSIRGM